MESLISCYFCQQFETEHDSRRMFSCKVRVCHNRTWLHRLATRHIRNRLNAVLKMCTTVVELPGGFNRKAIGKIPVDRKDIKSTHKSHLKVVLNFTVFTLDLSQNAEKRCTLQFLKL